MNDHHPVAVAGAKNYYEETTPGAGHTHTASLTHAPGGRSRGRSTSGGEFMNENGGTYYEQHAGAGGVHHQMYTDDDASQKSESSRRKLALGRALLGELRNIASSLDQLNGPEGGGEGKDSDEERARTGRISTLSDFLNAHSRNSRRDVLQPQHSSPFNDEASDFDGESMGDAHSMASEFDGRQRQRRDKHQKEVQRRESKRNRLENYRHNPSRRHLDHGDEADDDASCKTWSPNRPEGPAPQVSSGGSRRMGRRMSGHRADADRRRSVGDETVRRRLLSKNVVSSLLELAKDDEQAAAAALLGVAGRGFYSSHGAIPTDDEDSIADTGAAAAAAASGRSRPSRKSKLASKLKKKATRGIGSRGDFLDDGGMGSSFGSAGGAEAAAAIVAAATEGNGRGGTSKAEALLSTLKALAASLDDDSILDGEERERNDLPAPGNASRRRSYELALAALDVDGDQDDESTTVATTASASSAKRKNKRGENGDETAPAGGTPPGSSGRRSRKSRSKADGNRDKLVNDIVSDTYFKVRRSSTSGIADPLSAAGGEGGGGGGGEGGDSEVVPFTSNPDAQIIAQNFAAEHRIFLKAALDLLSSRDKRSSHTNADRVAKAVGTATAAPGAASVALKVGTLKKASHLMRGVWKAKYVEVRRGFFIYYEEEKGDGSDGDEVSKMRKAIPLETSRCTCRPVKIRNNPLGQASGFIFELTVAGGPKRLWMANTKEERYSWICAVYEAMVSASDFPSEASQRSTRGPSGGSDMAEPMSIPGMPSDCPHRDDLEQYLDVQDRLKHAETKIAYIGGLHELWRIPLRIPVQWIRVQMEASASANATDAFQEGTLCSGIEQLWKDMMRDSVSINGNVIKGDSGHGPERIIGALSKCIMDFDKSSALRRTSCSGSSSSKINRNLYRISEAQAISYARDILLACNRTRSAGDSYYCVDMLCSNQTLVVLCPKSSEAEPLQIVVRHATEDDRGSLSPKNGHSNKEGWIPIRSIGRRTWCNHYCILSEGVFSYYEKGYPKPHKLKGQLLLEDVKIQTSSEEVRGTGNPAENPLRKLKDRVGPQEGGPPGTMASPVHMAETSGVRRIVDVVSKDGSKGVQLCFQNDGEFQKWRGALQTSVDYYQGETGMTKPGSSSSLKVDDDGKGDGKPKKGLRAGLRSTVQVALEASTLYKICTTNPQGHHDEDTWATLQTKFVQSFRLSGGSNGRIMRGEEIVQMLILEGLAEDRDFERVLETTQSKIGLLEGLTERGFHR